MRKLVLLVPLSLVLFTVALSVDGSFYSALLERGITSFREGRYPQAVKELRIASFGLLDSIPNYETALVYLALAQQRTGDVGAAAASVRKLLDAERITPTYRTLRLDPPVRTAFEGLAATVLTRAELLALTGPAEARPPVVTDTPRREPPVTPTETVTTTADVEAERLEQRRREAARIEAERIESERRAVEAEADRRRREREEAERREAERREAERIAAQRREAERIDVQRREAERREEERREAERREAERRAAQQAAERREAERRETQRREAERREAEQRREAERREAQITPSPQLAVRSSQLTASERRQLTAAEEALQRGNSERAREIYLQLLNSSRPSRAALLEVGRGLYRVGDFRGSVSAFSRVGTIQRGEEEYHYYAAVSLFETGNFAAAKKQLVCALPFISMTDDVARYQAKIQAAIE